MIAICSRSCSPEGGGLLVVPVGAMGPFWAEHSSFQAVEGLWAVSGVEGSARAYL